MRLATFLLLGLALRLPAVVFARGYEFVDQQFQYVDPAYGLATGADWIRTWEWQAGLRSWAYPGLLSYILRALPIADPDLQMLAVRGVHALLSLLPLAGLWLVVMRWRPLANPQPVLWLAAASWVSVYAGVQPSGPTFALGFAVAAILFAHGPAAWPLLGGCCLGIAFCARVQDAFFGPVVVAGLCAQRNVRGALWFVAGCAPPVLFQCLLDLWTWGSFLHSPLAYVRVNFFENASASFGTTPIWRYAAILGVFLLPVAPEAWRCLRRGAALLPLPFWCAVAYLLLHAIPQRRQFRFIMPALALLFLVLAAGLAHDPGGDRWSRWWRRLLVGAHLVMLVLASCWYFHRGPIEAAKVLRSQPAYTGELCTVETDFDGIGGAYWLGRQRLALEVVGNRAALAEHLRTRAGGWPLFVMVKDTPLLPAHAGAAFTLHELAHTDDWLARESRERWVYRVERKRP